MTVSETFSSMFAIVIKFEKQVFFLNKNWELNPV